MKFLLISLRGRLMLCFMILALCPLLVIGVVSYQSGRQRIIKDVKSHLEGKAILKQHGIENWIEYLTHIVTLLVTNPRVKNDVTVLSTHATVDTKYRTAYESMLAGYRRMTTLKHFQLLCFIEHVEGRIIVSSDASWEGKIKHHEPYFLQGKREVFVSDIFFSLSIGRPTMVVSAPVTDDSGRLMGVMAGHVDLKHLSEIMLQSSGLSKTSETFLVNRSNLLLTDTVFAPNGAFKKWIFSQGVKWALEKKNGVGRFIDYREEKVIGAYRWLNHSKMALIAKQDESEAFAPAVALRNTILGIGIGVLLSVIILGMFLVRSITVPISRLVKGADEIGSGNLEYKVGTKAKDEIGVLSRAFDQMSVNLKKITVSRDELVKEISDKKRAEAALKSERDRAQNYLDIAGVMIIAINTDQKVTLVNAKGCQILGCDEADIIGKNWFENFLLEDEQKTVKGVFNGIISGDTEPAEYNENYILTKNNEQRLIAWHNSALTNQEGHIIGTLSSGEDITERKKIEIELAHNREYLEETVSKRTAELNQRISEVEQLNSAMVNLLEDLRISNQNLELTTRQLEDANKELESFSYSVSHDLRAPLRAIDGFTRILMEDYVTRLDDEGKRLGSVIQHNTQKMSQLIDDLLSFSRTGRAAMHFSAIDMKNMANAIYHEATDAKERKRVEFSVNNLPKVHGDPTMMRQVWINLISNALKFSAHIKQTIISITYQEKEKSIIYCIKDNGAGFDMKYKDKLFGVFQRLHSKKEFSGTGVGLALVQRIIHRHGGKVWAEGKVDEGAVFYFSLPKRKERLVISHQ